MPGCEICEGRNIEAIAGQKSINIFTVAGKFPNDHLGERIRQQQNGLPSRKRSYACGCDKNIAVNLILLRYSWREKGERSSWVQERGVARGRDVDGHRHKWDIVFGERRGRFA